MNRADAPKLLVIEGDAACACGRCRGVRLVGNERHPREPGQPRATNDM